MLEAIVLALILVGTYFVGLLVWRVGGMWRVVRSARRQSRASFQRELAAMTTEQIGEHLLDHPYLNSLRGHSAVEQFLSRIARGDEVALRDEFPRRRLYSMLVNCERAAGGPGRPEASDSITELDAVVDELARRAKGND